MAELARIDIADAPCASSTDVDVLIASLREAGAGQFDPVRVHYLEVLAKRAMAHQGSVRRLLDDKLTHAVATFSQRFELAQRDASEAIVRTAPHHPHAAEDLQRFFSAGDFKGLQRFIATLETRAQRASLTMLVRQLEQHSPAQGEAHLDGGAGSRPELKTIRNFRNTWSKLSSDKQVTKALGQAPKNAGPINSHMLVLRSLALMRDISPDYLNRFMSYADTLLSLEQCERETAVAAKKPRVTKAAKK